MHRDLGAEQRVLQLDRVPDLLDLDEFAVVVPERLGHLIDHVVGQVLVHHQHGDDAERRHVAGQAFIGVLRDHRIDIARVVGHELGAHRVVDGQEADARIEVEVDEGGLRHAGQAHESIDMPVLHQRDRVRIRDVVDRAAVLLHVVDVEAVIGEQQLGRGVAGPFGLAGADVLVLQVGVGHDLGILRHRGLQGGRIERREMPYIALRLGELALALRAIEGGMGVGPAELRLGPVHILHVGDAAAGAVRGGDAGHVLAQHLGDLGAERIPAAAGRSRHHADEGLGVGGRRRQQAGERQWRQPEEEFARGFHETSTP